MLSNHAPEHSSERTFPRIYGMLAFLFPALFYSTSLWFSFVYDDHELIVMRRVPTGVAEWLLMLFSPYYSGLPYYRPVPAMLFTIERYVAGLAPCYYHLTNVLIVSLSGLALFRLARADAFRISPPGALAFALICTLHPATSSTVYMISGREALLSSLLLVTCTLSYLRHGFRAGAALLLLLALGTRESSIAAIPLLFLLIVNPARPVSRIWRAAELGGLAAVTGIYFVARGVALTGSQATPSLNPDLMYVPLSYLYGLSSVLAPALTFRYEPALSEWLNLPQLVAMSAVIIGINCVLHRSGVLRSGRCWILIVAAALALLPSANIFIQETPFDERHLNTFLIPIVLLITLAMDSADIASSLRKLWYIPIACCLAVIAARRIPIFVSDDTFIDHWNAQAPDQPKVLNHLGAREIVRGNLAGARTLIDRSLTLAGNSPAFLYRARIRQMEGDLAGALGDLTSSLTLDASQPIALCDRSVIRLQMRDAFKSREDMLRAWELDRNAWCSLVAVQAWQSTVPWRDERLLWLPIASREALRAYDYNVKIMRELQPTLPVS